MYYGTNRDYNTVVGRARFRGWKKLRLASGILRRFRERPIVVLRVGHIAR
jgi:hypothetical protein